MSEATTIEPPKSRRGGKRPGAGGVFKPLTAQAAKAAKNLHPAYRSILARFRTLGLTQRQVVFELHCRQGKPLTVVAEIMDLDHSSVWRHWQHIKADIAANAPSTPEQFTAMREDIATRLWATVEDTYQRAEVVEGDKVTVIEMPPSPQMLAVRLKALDQLSKLYGVNLEQQAQDGGTPPYAAPDSIAEEVKRKILDLHKRPTSLLFSPQQLPETTSPTK